MKNKNRKRTGIENLKQQIRDVVGFDPVFGTAPDCPPDIEESFLKQVLRYEKQSKEPLRDRLRSAGVVLRDPKELRGDDVRGELWRVINALIALKIVPVNTDHLSDRELYEYLWKLVSSGKPGVIPHFFSKGWYIDCSGFDDDGIHTYLRYYATDEECVRYHLDFPDRPIPLHCDPPYDRDRLIPDL